MAAGRLQTAASAILGDSLALIRQNGSGLWTRGLCTEAANRPAAEYPAKEHDPSNFAGHQPQEGGAASSTQLRKVLRRTHAAEVLAASFFETKSQLTRQRPDLAHLSEQEQRALQRLAALLPSHRTRPSAFLGFLQGAGCALGIASNVLPRHLNLTITGALADALSEHYNQQLSELWESEDHSGQTVEVRDVLCQLRDLERAPEGGAPALDILSVQRIQTLADVEPDRLLAALVKMLTKQSLALTTEL